MALRYCFEQSYVDRTLARSKPHDLAVVDTEGHELSVKNAVSRGVWVYGYLNAGALERERPFYPQFKHLGLAKYDGWDGEYWIDPTAREWQEHCISLAKQIKATGAIGIYLDNTDIYYMCLQGFKEEKTKMLRSAPSAQAVYTALSRIILEIHKLGLIMMPNGGDVAQIGTNNGMTVQNVGMSGGTIADVSGHHCISGSVSDMRSDADYVIFEGGVNDCDLSVSLGTISSGYTATLDDSTFAGAFETMLKSAIARFPTAKIGYIFIHKCYGGFESTDGANSYYGVAKACCEKWGIPYLDLNTQTPPLRYIDALRTAYTLDGDGIHPNADGYRLFYVPKITAWMKTL